MRATFFSQFRALLVRNLLLKWRNRRQTLQEFLMPIYFVALLAMIKAFSSPKTWPAIESTAKFPLSTKAFTPELQLLFSPNSPEVQRLAPELVSMLGITSLPGYEIFDKPEDAENAYMRDKSASMTGIDFTDGTLPGMMNYTIRVPYASIGQSYQLYTGGGQCREAGAARSNCLANTYLYSGFSNIQVALDTLLIQMSAPGPINITKPQISVQMFPMKADTPGFNVIVYLAAIYFVLAYSPFIAFLSVNLVYEKEKKLKEAMRMMGMRDSAFWLSWGVLYAALIAVVTAVVVLIAYLVKLFNQSNMFIFYLILFLYGLSMVNLAFAITPLFEKAETAGGVSSLVTIMISLLYLIVSTTRGPTGASTIPVWGQYLLCLLSPVAVALSIDQGLTLDYAYGGMNFVTINQGVFPLSSMLIMLSVDIVLYGMLAFYLDNVIPNEFGFRRKAWFFLQASYWCPKDAGDSDEFALIGEEEGNNAQGNTIMKDTENMEAIAPEYRKKNMLRIFNLKKKYKTKEKEVYAVDGISLDIYEGQITALLGHNGAGKTTLLNMLTGMTPPTSGSATIYGLDVTDMGELNVLRTMVGFCPQHNILFDTLSPAEHLEYYGTIKGVQADRLQSEVENALKQVDLLDQRDTIAKHLSGGQKRKACVAIALIGNPKVMFLDEPTAGMDPASRRHLWRLLQNQRDKLIVLTTHFMDEADILADRKAIVSKGKLRCVGSSLFLKVRFGVGYHLSIGLEPSADAERILEFVKTHVAEAECHRHHGKELIVTLPITAVSAFPSLFAALEAKEDGQLISRSLGIATYGVSMTNLEEVFLKLGQEAEQDDDSLNNDSSDPLINDVRLNIEDRNSEAMPNSIPAIGGELERDGNKLWKQRLFALFRLRIRILLGNIPRVIFQIVFPLIFIIGACAMLKFIPLPAQPAPQSLHLQPSMYANTSKSSSLPNMLYLQASTSGKSGDFIAALRAQDLVLEEYGNVSELLGIAPHNLGVEITSVSESSQVLSSTLTAQYNTTAVHSIPSILNSFSTALLQMTSQASAVIATYSKPWPAISTVSAGFAGGIFGFGLLIGSGLASITPGFSVLVVKDRVEKAKNQLRLSGVTSNMYWASVFALDGFLFLVACIVCIIILVAFQIPSFSTGGAVLCLVLLLVLNVPVNMLLAYCMGYMFDKFETAQSVLPNLVIWSSMLPYMLVSILDFANLPAASVALHYVFAVIAPQYPTIGGLFFIDKVYMTAVDKSAVTFGQYFQWSSNIPILFIMPFVHTLFLYYLLRLLDVRSDGGNWRDAFRCSQSNKISDHIPETNRDIPEDEDEDVAAERRRVEEAVTSSDKEAIKVKNLRKEYPMAQTNGSCSSGGKKGKKVRVAVRNTSMLVEKGEVMGLLGPNGAGKTTTLNMVIAEVAPTKGKVYAAGHDIQSNLSDAFQAMGYCPQHDALWTEVTLRHHLEVYAAVRGITKDNINPVIEYYLEALKIKEHADKKSKELSGGTKRKLSYVMSMLGNPKVVLLDEPSTGMDPKSKRFLWDTISEAFNNDRRGAVLTTHYMDEADALCSRVAIMVNGEIECVGSTQRLKQKYGGGFQLEIKISRAATEEQKDANMAELKRYIEEVFPGAEQRELFGDRVLFHIPTSSVNALSQTFSALEKGKETHGIEEYSFSQATLEQVFLEFAKHQVEDENDDKDPSTLRQTMRLRRELSIDGGPRNSTVL